MIRGHYHNSELFFVESIFTVSVLIRANAFHVVSSTEHTWTFIGLADLLLR